MSGGHFEGTALRVKMIVSKVRAEDSEVVKCWRYTWLGPTTDKTNYTTKCSDLEAEEGPSR